VSDDDVVRAEIESMLSAGLTRRRLLQRLAVTGAALAVPSALARSAKALPPLLRTEVDATGDIGTITWGYPETITRMSLIHLSTGADENAIASTIEVLVNYDTNGNLVPVLAESWSAPDLQTYVYKIRKGVTFSDGTPMTMDDVLYSCLATWKEKGSVIAPLLANVKSMKQTGPNELTIKLLKPSATFKYLAVFLGVGKKSESVAHASELGTPAFLGTYTGPYAFESFVPGQSVTLVRNDNYWGKKPAAQKIIYEVFKDTTSMRLALQSREIAGAFKLPLTEIPTWQKLKTARTIVGKNPVQLIYISFDTKEAPWSDPHIRRAIAHCVDKKGIAKAIYKGVGAIPAHTLPAPSEWAAVGLTAAQANKLTQQIPDYDFDIAKAKAELAKSSMPNGFTNSVVVPSDSDPDITLIAESVSQNLKQIGVNLVVKPLPGSQVYGIWYSKKKNTGCVIIRNGPTFLDPSDYARIMLLKQFDVAGSYNSANYSDPQVEVLLKRAEESMSNAVRRESVIAALKIAARDEPYIPVVWGGGAMAVDDKYNYIGFHPWAYLIQEWGERIVAA
jgi:peptide/nickel transport system substrate-binding protein